MERYFTILEVSQKQAYIFSSNKLRDNIVNSEIIAYALSPDYLTQALSGNGYLDEKNMVYSGGGHTVLEFPSEKSARECVQVLTEKIYRDFDSLEVFAKTMQYDAGESIEKNLKQLTKELERKKAERRSAFRQGSFGVELIDTNTLSVKNINEESEEKKKISDAKAIQEREQEFCPIGFESVLEFEKLGGSKNENNFIAVVHIDGNGMGKRVEELYKLLESENADWEAAKKKIRMFSEGIADDYTDALKETAEEVGHAFGTGALNKLDYKIKSNGAILFPLRRIITAGDDICFVTEGRIGIECAVTFIKKLAEKKNIVDGKQYCASAGVAIVHQKYPFYKAYEIAEMLCGSAKKFGSSISPEDNGSCIGAIDWHIEYGELKDSVEEIRRNYLTAEGALHMEMRPYIVEAPDAILHDEQLEDRLYKSFKKRFRIIQEYEANGKIKELRNAIKAGEKETELYLRLNQMEELKSELAVKKVSVKSEQFQLFTEQKDGKKHSVVFDAIELMDAFLPFVREDD